MTSALQSPIEFEQEVIALQRHFRDLNLVAKSRRLTHRQGPIVPRHMVIRAVGIEFQRLLRTWYCHFRVRVFSRQVAHQTDFFVFREFVARVQNASLRKRDGKGG